MINTIILKQFLEIKIRKLSYSQYFEVIKDQGNYQVKC